MGKEGPQVSDPTPATAPGCSFICWSVGEAPGTWLCWPGDDEEGTGLGATGRVKVKAGRASGTHAGCLIAACKVAPDPSDRKQPPRFCRTPFPLNPLGEEPRVQPTPQGRGPGNQTAPLEAGFSKKSRASKHPSHPRAGGVQEWSHSGKVCSVHCLAPKTLASPSKALASKRFAASRRPLPGPPVCVHDRWRLLQICLVLELRLANHLASGCSRPVSDCIRLLGRSCGVRSVWGSKVEFTALSLTPRTVANEAQHVANEAQCVRGSRFEGSPTGPVYYIHVILRQEIALSLQRLPHSITDKNKQSCF